MKTASSREVNGRIDRPARSDGRSYWRAGARAVASETRRVTPRRWPFDLLALALSVLMVGATAVCGLAVVSRWVPPPRSLSTDGPMRGDREAFADSLGVRNVLPCCHETE
jgi:hypothetical protein